MGKHRTSQRKLSEIHAHEAREKTAKARWYTRAANAGHVKAQSLLGLLSESGQGMPQDYAEAAKWYRKAADAGDARAQTRLGFFSARGHGVKKDSAEAVRWWHRAAKQGNTEAQMLLGLAYASAEGVQKDHVQAYKWLSLVSSNPAAKSEQANEAASFRDELADKMTATQIAEAQKLARECNQE
jgi:TPR repeat protein